MDNKYDFKKVEEGKYQFWLDNDNFVAGKDKRKDAFAIVITDCSEDIKTKLEESINKNINKLNESLQKSTQLSVSTVTNFSIISDPSDVKTLVRETKDLLERISNAKKSQIN